MIKQKIYNTRAIDEASKESEIFSREVMTSVSKFLRLNYGDTSPEDIVVNDDALKYKDRVLAVYETTKGKIWIIAESDNSIEYNIITVLFPDDY